ncbi:MAG: tetratricopeptide repeat protein [Thermodesulfobacteriota bacterium]
MPDSPQSPAQLMQQANAFHVEGRLDEAIALYRLIIEQEPGASGAWYNLGLALRRRDRLTEAIEALRRALSCSQERPEFHLELGKTLLQNNQAHEAVLAFQAAATLNPDLLEAYYFLGLIARTQGEYATALTHLAMIPENSGKLYASARLEAAKAHFATQDFPAARAILSSLKEALPDNLEVFFYLGVISLEIGALPDALTALEQAVVLAPDNPHAHCELGNACYQAGRLEDAARSYENAIQAALPDPAARNFAMSTCCYNLGMALRNTGRLREAVKRYDESIRYAPADFGPRRLRIESASACNLRCRHCPTGLDYNATNRTVMTPELFDTLIQQMRGIRNIIDCVLYLGGEPLLNRNLAQMCRRVKEETSVTTTSFNTNAMLVTEEICRQLQGARVNRIQISVDGRSPDENDQIRQGSCYATVAKNIRLLKESLPTTQICIANTVIKRRDDPDVPEAPEFLRHDFPDLPIDTTYAMRWPGLSDRTMLGRHMQTSKLPAKGYCNKPFTEMVVRANGDITLCCYDILGEHVMGNIMRDNLLDVWKSSAYQELRAAILENQPESLPAVCRNCAIYSGEYLLTDNSLA